MAHGLSLSSPGGRGLLAAAVLGSGMAFLDSTAVNVALPPLQRSFEADLSLLQWTVDAYLLFLGALLLVGGALGDRYGRRRVFLIGTVGFALASLACGIAPGAGFLIAARAVQGTAAALLVPGSLALMRAAYREEDQGKAIGLWSGLSGVTSALGPIAGGWLAEAISWRAIFFLNLPLAAACVFATARFVPESRDEAANAPPDWVGAALATIGLGATVHALIEGPARGLSVETVAAALIGAAGLIGFVFIERHQRHPMLPLEIFRSRQFSGANLATMAIYAALGGAMFVLTLHLQGRLRYSPLQAGLVLTPVTVLLLLLSPPAAKVAGRIGSRWPMAAGSLIAGFGLVLLSFLNDQAPSLLAILIAVAVFGLGLSALVAPLTIAVLESVEQERSGLASGVNNAVARIAGLLAVAVLPPLAGLETASTGFRRAMLLCAALCGAGAVVSWASIRETRH
ncbi:MAG: MFS transporter [Deltaproteobacteria bacterium]|nr:MAG: MFS transporter [Deltaproteobacteria bacterium]